MVSKPFYRFKHVNVTLESYIQERHAVAKMMRRNADLLIRSAEAIEKEADNLQQCLLRADEEEK